MSHEETAVGRPSRLALLSATAALLLIGPMAGPASAHVSAATQEDPDPGTEVTLELSFDHGCAGEPTTELAVQLPDGIAHETVEPLEEDGWSATLDDRTVTWTGGEPVPDHVEHTFRVHLTLPDAPSETIYLPTIQRCEDDRYAWIQIPDEDQSWSELDEPAPALTLTDQPAPTAEDPNETEEVAPEPDEATPAATPEAEDVRAAEAFLTEDEPAAAFPIIVLAVLAGLAVLATIAVVVARRGGEDDPAA